MTGYAQLDPAVIWDPWEDPPPPAWPGNILPKEIDLILIDVAMRDGIDPGAAAMSAIAAVSGAAPKDARLAPYRGTWLAPPIVWLMTVGESGTRKTLLAQIGWPALRAVHAAHWRPYRTALKQWNNAPRDERGPKPEQPHSFIVDDITPEALQTVLANSMRGTALVKDELVALLEFGRYRKTGGEAGRAFLLSSYDDAPVQVHRVGRDSELIEHSGLTIYGNIQPRRLAGFQADMETDGLLQRFIPLRMGAAKLSQPDIRMAAELTTLHDAIGRLCRLPGGLYSVTPAGKDLIHETEQLARDYAGITDYGLGWPGFCSKLHATHARLALILHMLSDPEESEIPTATVTSAHRLVHRFILQHARDFYAALPGGGHGLSQDIAGWLLTRPPGQTTNGFERFLASDLTAGIRACRALSSRGIVEVLDPFVIGGWLIPENDYPSNRAWWFNPALRLHFAERAKAERERRRVARALIGKIEKDRGEQLS
jgi:Protein of unknown function (DUF3987)